MSFNLDTPGLAHYFLLPPSPSLDVAGHNWGSEHDPVGASDCNPPLNGVGKFLMYQSVNDGTLTNNVKFSECSVAYVEPVLTAKSFKCFERAGTGNSIVCPVKLGEQTTSIWLNLMHVPTAKTL